MNCPCGSPISFEDCCSPYLQGKKLPDSAEQLMRSRYTAFTRLDFPYLKKTLAPEARKGFDIDALKETAEKVEWKELQIISTEKGGLSDDTGVVEFKAIYLFGGETVEHHEVSQFRKDETGQWFFVEGEPKSAGAGAEAKPQTVVRAQPKVGRNDPCACGSGKKFKKCCAA